MFKKTITLIALLIAGANAASADWALIDAGEKSEVSVDIQGLVRLPNSLVKTWMRYSYLDNEYSRELVPRPYKAALVLNYFNCKDRTMATAQEVLYEDTSATKSIRTTTTPREKLDYTDVVPDSVGEAALNFSCTTALKKK